MVKKVELASAAGHLIRRAQQINGVIWAGEVGEQFTSLQFAVLNTLRQHGNLDQTRLGVIAAMDRSTTAEIVGRMVRRQLVVQAKDPADTRRNLLSLTEAGIQALDAMMPAVHRAGAKLVAPLTQEERRLLVRILAKLVDAPARSHGKKGGRAQAAADRGTVARNARTKIRAAPPSSRRRNGPRAQS